MEQDKLKASPLFPLLEGEGHSILIAEEGTSLSSGSLRLYYLLLSPPRRGAGGEAIGCIDLYNYDPLNHRCAVGIMVAKEHRRHGHALAMLRALQEQYADTLHTLYADIAASNTASLALFRKAGYTECGHFKDWLAIPLRPSATSLVPGEETPTPHVEEGITYIDSIRMQKIIS